MPSIETLPFVLKQLRLVTVLMQWEEVAEQAKRKQLGYGEFLAGLMALEMTAREQKRLEQAIRNAKLPFGKYLSNFDFSITSSENAAQITMLAEDRKWVDNAENLIFFGPSGTGKTHLAAAITYSLLERGVKACWFSTTLLVQSLQQAKAEYKLKAMLDRLSRFDLLVLDDIGYVKKSEQETCVLFELIANRYETGSLLITANQPFSDWDGLFPDKIMAVAAIDRLVHHATIIRVHEESHRAREARNRTIKQQDKEVDRT